MSQNQTATIDKPRTTSDEKRGSVKLLVLYPPPVDAEQFDRRYLKEHLPMGQASMAGATGLASYRILGSPAGKSPFARLTEVTFPSMQALQAAAALPAVQKTMANAVEISTGGAPHFLIVEQEG